jgi:hypothetical protein
MPAAAARWRIMARAFGWGRGLSKCAPHLSRALRSRLFETAGSWDRRRCRFVRDYSPERCRARLRGGRDTQTMYWVEARPNRPLCRCLAIAGALAAQRSPTTIPLYPLHCGRRCPAWLPAAGSASRTPVSVFVGPCGADRGPKALIAVLLHRPNDVGGLTTAHLILLSSSPSSLRP